MNKRKWKWIVIFGLFFVSSLSGYLAGGRSPQILKEEETPAVAEKKKETGENCMLLQQWRYALCGHKEERESRLASGLTKEEVAALYPDFSMHSFSENKVVLIRKIDGYCQNHVLLKLSGKEICMEKAKPMSDCMQLIRSVSVEGKILSKEIKIQLEKGKVFANMGEAERFLNQI